MKIDERNKMTFPQLWLTLTVKEAGEVRKNIRGELKRCAATFWRWYNGMATPESYAEKKQFAKVINKTLGMNTDADTLFPNK